MALSAPAANGGDVLLETKNLRKHFPIEQGVLKRVVGHVKAVDDVTLHVNRGETFGLVGESGSGKTTFGRCILRAIEPTSGTVRFRFGDGELTDLLALDKRTLRERRRDLQMVFQDPYSSLDPRMTVLDIVGEPLRLHGIARGRELEERVMDLMGVVGLEAKHLKRYPHAFSGGQRQRIGIARALATNPKLIVCDEPVSSLDVSIQAQILNLLQELQRKFRLTYVFIAHNLSIVEHISDRVAVMYLGRIAEMAETDDLFETPTHPYTEALLSAVPRTDPDAKMDRIILPGEIPNPADPPPGCPFHPRCRYAQRACKEQEPGWIEVAPRHFAACHFAGTLRLKGIGVTGDA